jgi:serine O-acetyltransferase
MSARTEANKDAQGDSGPLALLVVAGGTYTFLRKTEIGKRLISTMMRDIQAIKERDPAARSDLEVLTCYPGLHALWLHRLAHALWKRQVPLVPRLISEFGRLVTGTEIHPGATIGEGFFIDHGAGVVIGETAEVGDNVTIYQNVTLGGTGKETGKRHPTVGDNVVIGAGSNLLGSITVGDYVKIGSGSVVVQDVPSNSTVVGNPGRPVISQGTKVGIPDIDYTHLPDPVAEAMKCLVRRVVQLENELEEIRKALGGSGGTESSGPVASRRPQRPIPAAEVACDPVRTDGIPAI